jgi:PilZ domain-containing protein
VSTKMFDLDYESGEPRPTKQERSDASVRTQMRFPIAAPVKFNWLARNGTQHQGTGRSRNVSEGGAFVFTRKLPPIGACIDLSIQFPSAALNGRILRMEMTGEVVRLELPLDHKSKWGFAVVRKRRSLNLFRDRKIAPSLRIQ